ncbi:hypothetical protein CBL_03769 [Carabus blaptoides fortunei]
MPATPAKNVTKSPEQNTPKSAKRPMTPKMEKKNTPNKGATPKQNAKSPQKKAFTPKQTPEKKVTPQKRKSDDNATGLQVKDCGDIRSIRLIRDKQTRIGKGFGYVNFISADAVELALQMEDIKMGKREIRVSRCSKGGSGPGAQNKKRNADGKKNRKVPRTPKPESTDIKEDVKTVDEEKKDDKPAEFQGAKFTDKKKKKRLSKAELKKKKLSKILAAKA